MEFAVLTVGKDSILKRWYVFSERSELQRCFKFRYHNLSVSKLNVVFLVTFAIL